MLDREKLQEELRRIQGKPPLKTEPCPVCLRKLTVHKAKKDNENKGREFVSCECCEVFEWLDMPMCSGCGRREYQAVCKSGKNEGRCYHTCPGGCSFRWVSGQQ